jgi:hypothetical protein
VRAEVERADYNHHIKRAAMPFWQLPPSFWQNDPSMDSPYRKSSISPDNNFARKGSNRAGQYWSRTQMREPIWLLKPSRDPR